MEKDDLYIVIILLFASLIALTLGILKESYLFSVVGIFLGALGLYLKRIKICCPHCSTSIKLSDALEARDKEITCRTCKNKIRAL